MAQVVFEDPIHHISGKISKKFRTTYNYRSSRSVSTPPFAVSVTCRTNPTPRRSSCTARSLLLWQLLPARVWLTHRKPLPTWLRSRRKPSTRPSTATSSAKSGTRGRGKIAALEDRCA